MIKYFASIILCSASLILAGCPDKIETVPPPTITPGMIVYSNYDVTSSTIIPTVRIIDTEGNQKLEIADASKALLFCSQGLGKIAYMTGNSKTSTLQKKIIVTNYDNTSQRELYAQAVGQAIYTNSIVLSHDGTKLLYATRDSSAARAHLYCINTDGTGLKLISNLFNDKTIPAFNNDGSIVAYYTDNDIIRVTSVDLSSNTSIGTSVNAGNDGDGIIAWRNNSEFTYTSNGNIYLVRLSKVTESILIDNGATPSWSLDGSTLAYAKNGDIFTTSDMGLTTTNITNSTSIIEAHPEWSSDGKKLICTSWVGSVPNSTLSLQLIDRLTLQNKVIATPGILGYFLK